MTTASTDTTAADDVTAPIIAIGPCGSDLLTVDRSVEAALAHLTEHGVALEPDVALEPEIDAGSRSALTIYDGRGRPLRIDDTHGRVTLVVSDDEYRRGELCARIEEVFAHVRERAYRDPDMLAGLGSLQPADIRPPDPPRAGDTSPEPPAHEYERFLGELLERMSPDPDIHQHRASWWHNLFHRI